MRNSAQFSVDFPRKDTLKRHIKGVHHKEGKTNPDITVKFERSENGGTENAYNPAAPPLPVQQGGPWDPQFYTNWPPHFLSHFGNHVP